MKTFFIILVSIIFFSCTDTNDMLIDNNKPETKEPSVSVRLNFPDEFSLENAIESGEFLDGNTRSRMAIETPTNFVSMLSKMPRMARSLDGELDEELTYYEALGYDTLVPNQNFAALLTIDGELEVGSEVIRITPVGTYKFPLNFELECNKFLDENPDYLGTLISEDVYQVTDKITLYRTFEQKPEDFSVIAEGTYTDLPDDFMGDDDELDQPIGRSMLRASNEPDFTKFETYSADRKTWFGKLIQNVIGSTKTSTVNFNKKRRVRGSFYSYNYGVYAEIGAKGWTDKKNKIGWSKTRADELRVGWESVVLKKTIPSYYKQSLQNLNSTIHYKPEYMTVSGVRYKVATLIMPDFKDKTLRDDIFSKGVPALISFVKGQIQSGQGNPKEKQNAISELEKAEAFIVATKTELFFVPNQRAVIKYNTKYYCHVFSKTWMDVVVGYNTESGGWNINGIGQNNITTTKPWLNAISDSFKEKKTTLVGGEIYVCARLGNEWRGMKIKKTDKSK